MFLFGSLLSLLYRQHQGTHICDPHDGGPPLGGECWYNCTLEDIAGEEKKRLLPEGANLVPFLFLLYSIC